MLFVELACLSCAGLTLLALSQDRNWRRVTDAAPRSRRTRAGWRVAGGGLIALGLMLALRCDGPSFGSLLWTAVLSLAALAVVIALNLWAAVRGRLWPPARSLS